MNAADPASAHEPDTGSAAHGERPSDGGRPDLAPGDDRRKVPRPGLSRRCVEPLQLVGREPDADLAVEDADRGGNGAGGANTSLALERDLDALARREPVRDEGRLEGDDGARLAYLVCDADHGIVPSRATQRAAVVIATSGPPTR